MAAVALESAVITHGLPPPHNLEIARELEATVREVGAQPFTVGVIDGEPVCGLSAADVELLASAQDVLKISTRDLPVAALQQRTGGTTVAATMRIAAANGIQVFATGGIGGIHRRLEPFAPLDVSADLPALATFPLCTVCAGAKAILDLPATLEALETLGVTVAGYQTDELPAFYSRSSGLPVDVRVDTPEEAANLLLARLGLGLAGGLLLAVPIPHEHEIPRQEIEPVIEEAVVNATERGLRSGEVTPFLLDRLAHATANRSIAANRALLLNNARVAAMVALAIARRDST